MSNPTHEENLEEEYLNAQTETPGIMELLERMEKRFRWQIKLAGLLFLLVGVLLFRLDTTTEKGPDPVLCGFATTLAGLCLLLGVRGSRGLLRLLFEAGRRGMTGNR